MDSRSAASAPPIPGLAARATRSPPSRSRHPPRKSESRQGLELPTPSCSQDHHRLTATSDTASSQRLASAETELAASPAHPTTTSRMATIRTSQLASGHLPRSRPIALPITEGLANNSEPATIRAGAVRRTDRRGSASPHASRRASLTPRTNRVTPPTRTSKRAPHHCRSIGSLPPPGPPHTARPRAVLPPAPRQPCAAPIPRRASLSASRSETPASDEEEAPCPPRADAPFPMKAGISGSHTPPQRPVLQAQLKRRQLKILPYRNRTQRLDVALDAASLSLSIAAGLCFQPARGLHPSKDLGPNWAPEPPPALTPETKKPQPVRGFFE